LRHNTYTQNVKNIALITHIKEKTQNYSISLSYYGVDTFNKIEGITSFTAVSYRAVSDILPCGHICPQHHTCSNDAFVGRLNKTLSITIETKNFHLLTRASLPIVHFNPHLSIIFRLREQAAYSSSSLYSSQCCCKTASRSRFDTIK